jgi:hypothetical protein
MKKLLKTKGESLNLFKTNLFDNIRKRLNLTKQELPDKLIRSTLKFCNKRLGKFLLDNPEGFSMTIGTQLNGVLAISKHLPKEMRDNKFEKYEEIENMAHIPDWRKKILLKRYSTALERRLNYEKLHKGEKQIELNTHSFFYSYKPMWFNHRNCKIKKTKAYEWSPPKWLTKELNEKILAGEDYFELNFHDFYRYKVKPIQ